MRSCCVLIALCAVVSPLRADDRVWPLVEKYLHQGELARGEQALEKELAVRPNDDQVRFGLGFLRLVKGAERMGQSFFEYGLKSEHASYPFVRFPVAMNPNPSTIRYLTFRRILDDFYRDLDATEQTLAGIRDENVKLPIRLANIRLDLDGNGKAHDRLVDVLKKLMRQNTFGWEKGNSEFLVSFDRGDVAWMRAYCHLLMGMLDVYLSLDTEASFDLWAGELFAKPERHENLTTQERWERSREVTSIIRFKEPARLERFRQHMLKMIALNREAWKFIKAEKDDDHEWLPHPSQTGVLGLPVREAMITAWHDVLDELENVLEGRSVLRFLGSEGDRGFNVKRFLEEPPEQIQSTTDLKTKYYTQGKDFNGAVFWRVMQVFDTSLAMGYMLWFN